MNIIFIIQSLQLNGILLCIDRGLMAEGQTRCVWSGRSPSKQQWLCDALAGVGETPIILSADLTALCSSQSTQWCRRCIHKKFVFHKKSRTTASSYDRTSAGRPSERSTLKNLVPLTLQSPWWAGEGGQSVTVSLVWSALRDRLLLYHLPL